MRPKKIQKIASAEGVSTVPKISIDHLPDEIMMNIFSYMSFAELLVLQKVCLRWRKLSHTSSLWTEKEYIIVSPAYLAAISAIRTPAGYYGTPSGYYDDVTYYADNYTCGRCKQLNSNRLPRHMSKSYMDSKKFCASDEEMIQTFHNAPSLRIVRMRRPVNMCVFRALYENCHNLAVLELHRTQHLSYSVLNDIVEKCSSIHTLTISNELMKDKKVSETISQLQHLRVLILDLLSTQSPPVLQPLGDGCPKLSELCFRLEEYRKWLNNDINDLKYFLNAKKNTLKSISVWGQAFPRWFVVLLQAVCAGSLERLHLHKVDIHNEETEVFTALGRLKNLEDLGITMNGLPPIGTFALMFSTGGLSKLRRLNLTYASGLEDEAVIAVCRGCPALMELRIMDGCRLSDAAFSEIDRLQNLEVLEVSCCPGLRNALIPYLAMLPRLNSLIMEEMDFRKLQPGVSNILELSTLSRLVLNESVITGVPFNEFPEKLNNLRELYIDYCTGDLRGLDGLRERMPGLKIYR